MYDEREEHCELVKPIWSTTPSPPCVQVSIALISIQEGEIFRGAHLQWSFRHHRREAA